MATGSVHINSIPRRAAARAGAVAVAAALGIAGVSAAPSGAVATSTKTICHYTWGSLPKVQPAMPASTVENVRSGRHTCFDRLVVDIDGNRPGYNIRYVSKLTQPGSGNTVAVRGGARIQITINAPAYDENGNATYNPPNKKEIVNVAGYSAFRQAVWLGSYEGYTDLGLGVRARTPFRVFSLDDGATARLVIDVAHNW